MSLLTALHTGVSGLRSYGDSLQVISDNIANVNTPAFKAARAEFADLISQTINGSAGRSQLGRGVQLAGITTSFEQGSLANTDRLTDLAINGNGFFLVQKDNQQLYTRNGQLTLNNQGQLVNSQGMNLIGYQYGPDGRALGTLGPLQFANSQLSPQMTGDVKVHANLNSSSPVTTFDPTDAIGTSNFSTALSVYDSLGNSHTMHIYFNKTGDNAWAWHGLMDGSEVMGGTPGEAMELAGGTLTFTANGALQAATTDQSSFNFTGNPQAISFDFGSAIADGGNGLTGSTQFASPNFINSQSQDGLPAGSLTSVAVDGKGIVSGVYSNGRTIPIGQIALANFPNLNGLYKTGSGLYQETLGSGVPVIGQPDSGGLGTISAYSLELSNVDLAKEFVDMISTQRAYQANSRVITVGDQLLSELINIVR